MYNPENGLLHNPEPPEPDHIVADCGCWLYDGDEIYDWCGETHCEDCFKDFVDSLSLHELADKLGAEIRTVDVVDRDE